MADSNKDTGESKMPAVEKRERPAERMAAPLLRIDLASEIAKIRSELPKGGAKRSAKTLVNQPDLSLILIVMQSGSRLNQHSAEGRISVQAIDGHMRLHIGTEVVDLPAGHLLEIHPGILHDLEALQDSACLLTMIKR